MSDVPENQNDFILASSSITRARRLLCRDFSKFRKVYFKHYHKKPDAKFHAELAVLLNEMTDKRAIKYAIAAPRETAKSTIVTLEYALFCICYKLEKFILIISETSSQATGNLDNIKMELESNKLLIRDFPEVCEIGIKPGPPRWRNDEIITRNAVKVLALGTGQQVRGRRNKEFRPSLIILDDAETDENSPGMKSSDKLRSWITKTVLNAGSSTSNVIFIGTIHYSNSLLARFTDSTLSPEWNKNVYRSVISWSKHPELWEKWSNIFTYQEKYEDEEGLKAAKMFFEANKEVMLEGTDVLWPHNKSYYDLMVMREADEEAFNSEMQNDPFHNKNESYFKEIHVWEDKFATEEELLSVIGEDGQFFGACDHSLGTQDRHGGYSAIVTAVWDSERRFICVIDADMKRRLPDMLIADIQSYHLKRRCETFSFDADQPHGFMLDELGARSGFQKPSLTIKQVKHETDKLARIQTLQPMIKDGSILFSRKHLKLLEQIRSFPAGKHDNILNALVMALEPCIQLSKIPVIYMCGVGEGGKIVSKFKITRKGNIPVPILEGEMAEGFPKPNP